MVTDQFLRQYIDGQKVAILGFGMEGQSTYRTLRKYVPAIQLIVCDKNGEIDGNSALLKSDNQTQWHLDADYMRGLSGAGIIIRSPGIPTHVMDAIHFGGEVTSQTELFVRMFRDQVTGITGTKGKSTTSSLLNHIFLQTDMPSLLVGNIGIPPFDLIDNIGSDTQIVFEMSSHQLEKIRISPARAILLNIFEEHLDHYHDFAHYRQAKLNIARWQGHSDLFIYNPDIAGIDVDFASMDMESTRVVLKESTAAENCAYFQGDDLVFKMKGNTRKIPSLATGRTIPGHHNLNNIAAAAVVALQAGVCPEAIKKAVRSFKALPHRMEFVGMVNGISFYNDSISTIPESAMAAIETFPLASTIILGGFDRGISYESFMDYLARSSIKNLIFTGNAGKRMMDYTRQDKKWQSRKCLFANSFDDAFSMAANACQPGETCLLSPAAASYDTFANFRERGERFRELVLALSKNPSRK